MSLIGLFSLLPGVEMVRLRFEGRLLGGVGGLMKDGDAGAEGFFSFLSTTSVEAFWAVRRFPSEEEVLMPRFFKFRGFLAGVVGLASSKKVFVLGSCDGLSVLRDRKSATKEVEAVFATGDSGDCPGDGSVTVEESMVEMVVVGELSEEAVDVLSRLSR